jgi:hypothetical protein
MLPIPDGLLYATNRREGPNPDSCNLQKLELAPFRLLAKLM